MTAPRPPEFSERNERATNKKKAKAKRDDEAKTGTKDNGVDTRAVEAAPDLEQARRFVELLTGDPDTPVAFRTFDDDKERGDAGLAQNFFGPLSQHEDALAALNARGAGVFITVNETDGRGQRKKNVVAIRANFLDLDGVPRADLENHFPLIPHITVESSPGHHTHDYFLVKGEALAEFTALQLMLAERFGGDEKIKDLPRVMRLPGFFNMKPRLARPHLVRIVNENPLLTHYTPQQIREGIDVSRALQDAAGRRTGDTDGANVRAECAVIPDGERNSRLTALAGSMRRRRLGRDEIEAELQAVNERQCTPPLSRSEVATIATSVAGYEPGGPPPLTDAGNALRFAARHGADVRYVHTWKYWLVWDDRRWARDETGEVMRMAKDTATAIFDEVGPALTRGGEAEAKAVTKWGYQSQSRQRLEATLALAQSEPYVAARAGDFDRESHLFNVESGTIDLRTMTHREHDRGDMITMMAPVAFDAEAECPRWDKFLERITDKNVALMAYLRRRTGYHLTGDVSEQTFDMDVGVGANGKTTLIEAIHAVMGEYAAKAEMATFTQKYADGVRNDLAALRGKRLVTAVEVGKDRRLDESLIKQLTGGDTITARFLYAEYFEYRPQFKIVIAANNRPKIREATEAIWRRVHLVPFDVVIPEEERDKALPEKLRAELPGILNWALRGCGEWRRDGLKPPEEVRAATADYRREQDLLADFLEMECWTGPTGDGKDDAGAWLHAPMRRTFEAYEAFCEQNGDEAVRKRTFGNMMTERGFKSVPWRPANKGGRKGKTLKAYRGVVLQSDVKEATLFSDAAEPAPEEGGVVEVDGAEEAPF